MKTLHRIRVYGCLLAVMAMVAVPAEAQYKQPPAAVLEVLNAPPTPSVSFSPDATTMVVIGRPSYPSIADLSEPMLRLAGLRLNPATNGPFTTNYNTAFTLKKVAGGAETRLATPANARLSSPNWSPDSKYFAFMNTTESGIELWIASVESASARKINNVVLNDAYGDAIHWMPDSRRLLVQLVLANRGPAPQTPRVPAGPNVQETSGNAGPVRTYQDLLETAHDADVFDYYATAQLAFVDVASGQVTPFGQPALYNMLEVSPDGNYFLVARLRRPYSYLHTHNSFPKDVEVLDRNGRVVYQIGQFGLQDRIPIGGVTTNPRSHEWQPTEPATLVWVEALDNGDPDARVPHRDRIMRLSAPFNGQPAELMRLEHRYGGIDWFEDGRQALISQNDRDRRWEQTFLVDLNNPANPKLIWDRSSQDRYSDPGNPVSWDLPSGYSAVMQVGDFIFLDGAGGSPEGDRPFLDRLNLRTLETQRLFRSGADAYESVVRPLNHEGTAWVTQHETPTEPPNYRVRTVSGNTTTVSSALTDFPDPTPQLRRISKQLVTYEREDGVPMSFTLYLPPDYQPGTRLPTLVWAYPREYVNADTAGQVSGSTNRFTRIGGTSHLFFVLAGYAVLDEASMPIIGDPETVNNTFVQQLVMNAEAAVNKATELGVTDPNRVGIAGHSYGAFMTANLLAHSDVFRAGIARSGAYNRTLTPFGFQNEQRTFWEAPEVYFNMSPFMHAQKINEPILLIHGEADNNSGTFPVQSDRLYQAIRGLGGTARLVTLPHESHGYAARESIEHTLFEMIEWFERFVKDVPASGSGGR